MNAAKVISAFDGMACGMLAMMEAEVQVEQYAAYEIDKFAVKTSSHNFPDIEHKGDVFQADFTEFSGFDFLVGGSPCTYWSIAQKNNRETVASGMGWELFSQYVRALHESKPRFFIYENNKSMSDAIRASITETFGFEPICINSALVSAQNRRRLYWVGKRNEDGSYSKVHVEQPEDRGILLKDVLDEAVAIREKGNCLCGNRGGTSLGHDLKESRHNYAAVPVNDTADRKSQCLRASCYKDGIRNMVGNDIDRKTCVAERVPEYGDADKARCVTASYANKGDGEGSLATEAFPNNPNKQVRDYVAEELPGFAIAVEWDEEGRPTAAVSPADGKRHPVYEVNNGFITIKGKKYAIKLADGYWIIRKLTVSECKRLQTVPEWYEFPVSDTQAYKMLGNGWTVSVIAHLIRACLESGGSNER